GDASRSLLCRARGHPHGDEAVTPSGCGSDRATATTASKPRVQERCEQPPCRPLVELLGCKELPGGRNIARGAKKPAETGRQGGGGEKAHDPQRLAPSPSTLALDPGLAPGPRPWPSPLALRTRARPLPAASASPRT